MPVYLISYEIEGSGKNYRAFFDTIEGLGTACKITATTLMVEADIEIEELIDELTSTLKDKDVLLVIDLETMEVNGHNLPECIEEFLSSPDDDEMYYDEDDEDEEEVEDEEDEK